MKVTTAEFVVSAAGPGQYPKGNLPEIAFVGRSNVGKSSLLNSLTGRKKLADQRHRQNPSYFFFH